MLVRVLIAVVLALLLGIGGVLLLTIGTREQETDPAHASATADAELAELRAERDRLQARVRELEALAVPAAARAPVAGDAAADARTAALERELAELRAKVAELERAEPHTADEIVDALVQLDPNDPQGIKARMARRIALLERFLELYPTDPRAADYLVELSGQYVQSQPAESLRALERYSDKVGLTGWKRDEVVANSLFFNERMDEADQAYQRIVNDLSAPEWRRWNARFFAAYMYMRTGRYDEARRRFEALVADAGPDPAPELRQTIDGAKEQLRQIESLTGER